MELGPHWATLGGPIIFILEKGDELIYGLQPTVYPDLAQLPISRLLSIQ